MAWLRNASILLAVLLAACSASPEAIATSTITPAITETSAPSALPTVELTATSTIANGTIRVAQASCRVGPGGAYMLRITLYAGDAVEVLGRMAQNENWLLLRTTTLMCWMGTNLVTFPEDVTLTTIENPHAVLPLSSYYGPLDNVSASREGDVVTVRWAPFDLRADDKSEFVPFIVEAWLCQNGQFVFRTYGTQERRVEIRDERGACAERSHARVIGAEKHGYTPAREVPWP